jgi:hypothetical protein
MKPVSRGEVTKKLGANRDQTSGDPSRGLRQEIQDDAFGLQILLPGKQPTILKRDTGFHPRIWALGNPAPNVIGKPFEAQMYPLKEVTF